MNEAPHELALTKAKIGLMSRPDSAFFTTLVFGLKHVFNPNIPTACTNGTTVQYNPQFFMSLDHEERIFLILHEAMHCALLHMERLGQMDATKWNIACDHYINLLLIARGFRMPACGLADRQYEHCTSSDEIYKLLPDQPPPEHSGGIGNDLKAPEEPMEDVIREVQDILVRAQIQSKLSEDKPGTIPGEIEIFLNKLLNPKLPWNRILQKYLLTFAKNDYTFKRPNRRFFPDHHLPSLYSQNLIDLACFVDTSGSVSDHEFQQQVSETATILKMMKPSKISFGQFDTQIKSVDEIRNIRDMMGVKFTGRGGTRIGPVIEWANTHKPQLLLVFSDGGFRFHEETTKIPTIWLVYNNPRFTAPFGKVIHFEV